MTRILSAALMFGMAIPAAAQVSQEELVKRRDAKLAEPWLQKAKWTLDYDEALAESAKSGKLVFAYFTRSYAP